MSHVKQSFVHLLGSVAEPVELNRGGDVASFMIDVGDGTVVPVQVISSGALAHSGDDLHEGAPVQVVGRLGLRNASIGVVVDLQAGHRISVLASASPTVLRSQRQREAEPEHRPFAPPDASGGDDMSDRFDVPPPSVAGEPETSRRPMPSGPRGGLGSMPSLGQGSGLGSGLQRPRSIGTMAPRIDRPDPPKPPSQPRQPDQDPGVQRFTDTGQGRDASSAQEQERQAAPVRRKGQWDMPGEGDPILKIPF